MDIPNCSGMHKNYLILGQFLLINQSEPPKGGRLNTNIMEIVASRKEKVLVSDVKSRLSDIIMKITWREIANDYFGKSSSWLYHKLDGINGAGERGGFSEDEIIMLKGALVDLSDKIRKAADRL